MNKRLLLLLLFSSTWFAAQTYCIPTFSDGCDLGDHIDSFSIPSAGFNHQNTECSANSYGNFTSQIINLNAGVNYNFTITHGFGSQNVKIWIDFNNDGTFSDSFPELVSTATSTAISNLDTTSGTANIPSTVSSGTYRMRVATKFEDEPSPCNLDGYGEAHDYTVSIGVAPSCLAPTNVVVSNITSSTALLTWPAPADVPEAGYEYFLSTNSTAPTSTTQATGTVVNATNVSLNVVSSTTYYVWVRSACTSSDKSLWSASVIFESGCVPISSDYTNSFTVFPGTCWSQASGGNPASGSTGSDLYWYENGFLNVNYVGAAAINLYSQNRAGWLKSPVFNLSSGVHRVKFDYGITEFDESTSSTMGSDDIIQFLISNNGGATWSVLQTWNASNIPSNNGNQFSLDLNSYNSANTVFAFYASDGAVTDPQDYEFFVDNFTVEQTGSLATSEIGKNKKETAVYPNPFTDIINIKSSEDIVSAMVTDFNGRIFKRFDNLNSALNLNELTSGVYILVLKMKDGTQQSKKIIKK